MRIVFMGTPIFAVNALKAIYESKHKVIGVVTSADKPAGRGKKLRQSAVKDYAAKEGLNLLQPENLKDIGFIDSLKNLKADIFVVVAFRMLPKSVWNIPTKGTFNLHASLLPNYRGAAPINWAIINNEISTGVTTFFIDDKIDTGKILLKKTIAINPKETVGSLHDKLAPIGASLILETIDYIETNPSPVEQQLTGNEKEAPKLTKENTKIDLDLINNKVLKLMRDRNFLSTKNKIFTEKSLENFFYIDIILKLFPKAKFINTFRNIEDNIFAIYQQALTKLSWTHSIENILKYVDNYLKIIVYFKKKYPENILSLELEELTSKPEETSKKLYAFCNLKWNEKALEFYSRKDLPILTASNIQIRKNIQKYDHEKYKPYKKILKKFLHKYPWINKG